MSEQDPYGRYSAGDETRAYARVQPQPAGEDVLTGPASSNGFSQAERDARTADKGSVKNWLLTGDKKLSLDSAAGKALAPAINDGYAITSLVTSLLGFGLFGVIFGVLAIHEARRDQRRVSGLAIGGIAVGVLEFVVVALIIAFVIASAIFVSSQVATYNGG